MRLQAFPSRLSTPPLLVYLSPILPLCRQPHCLDSDSCQGIHELRACSYKRNLKILQQNTKMLTLLPLKIFSFKKNWFSRNSLDKDNDELNLTDDKLWIVA